jgi:hypothetical protein
MKTPKKQAAKKQAAKKSLKKSSAKKSAKKTKAGKRGKKPTGMVTARQVIVYDVRPGGQAGQQQDQLTGTIIVFSVWKLDGVHAPDVRLGQSVPFEIGDNAKSINKKITEAAMTLYKDEVQEGQPEARKGVKKEDVIILPGSLGRT